MRLSLRLFAALVLLASLPEAQEPRQSRLAAALRNAAAGSAPPGPEFFAAARAEPRELFEFLCAGEIPPLEGSEEGPMRLEPLQERWILDGARSLGRTEVLALVRSALGSARSAESRAAAIRFIGTVGGAADLDELFTLALAPDEEVLDRRAREALHLAAGEILGRETQAFQRLNTRWRTLREPLIEPLLLAAGEVPGAPALEFLTAVISKSGPQTPLALSEVREIGRSLDPVADGEARASIRSLLDPRDGELCRAAALALGELGDQESIPDLIALLEEVPGLQANAHWALRRITGLSLPARVEPWESWHHQELAWLEESRDAELGRLGSTELVVVAEAIRSLAAHPLAREDLAVALVELLASADPGVRVLACRGLSMRGDARAYPGLLALLEDQEAEVAAAAAAALRKLTGKDLPPLRMAWAAELSRT